jgi:PPK2 family polyphosphate:nucleotide phosphotransferase
VAHHRLDPAPADLVSRLRVHKKLDLADHDPAETFGWSKQPATDALPAELSALADLQKRLFAEGTRSVLVVLQAIDAGGKDGTLREVFTGVNPAGVSVRSFGVPSDEELAHDYLWRVHQHTPADGQIGVFNRSHYEDVLVVRVKRLAPDKVWKKRYGHIKAFEQMLVDEGTTVVKVFLNVSKDEQRERLQDRVDSPDERWKFRRGDLDDRALWNDYQQAFHEMMVRTSTVSAPWYVVPADRKWVRNLCVAAIMRHTLDELDPQYPEPEEGIEGIVVE